MEFDKWLAVPMESLPNWTEVATFWATAGTGFVVAIYTVVTFLLHRTSRRHLRLAEDQLQLARDQFVEYRIAQESERQRSHAAYCLVPQLIGATRFQSEPGFTLGLKNVGNTVFLGEFLCETHRVSARFLTANETWASGEELRLDIHFLDNEPPTYNLSIDVTYKTLLRTTEAVRLKYDGTSLSVEKYGTIATTTITAALAS